MSLDANGETKLYIASENNNIAEVNANIQEAKSLGILEELVNKAETEYNITPLYASSSLGHTEVVNVLIQNGSNINTCLLFRFERRCGSGYTDA